MRSSVYSSVKHVGSLHRMTHGLAPKAASRKLLSHLSLCLAGMHKGSTDQVLLSNVVPAMHVQHTWFNKEGVMKNCPDILQ